MTHRDTVVNCNCIEFCCKAAEFLYLSLDFLAYFMKMHMAGNELSERIDNCKIGRAHV